ncbi:MAG: O-acetylhomoserine aminocarboxypropyltransferase/cysteine synthase [Thermaerobacter sp.]|nr:O-acetylhomoserine aminocarboxypropyltransferase/cysteine synthase [Thermaerobacter sp.]
MPLRFHTLSVHAGQSPDPTTGAVGVPLHRTTAYAFRDTAHAARLFALEEVGNIYTRIMNPTTGAFEERIAALEGGVGALAASSGQAAITMALLNICQQGQSVVASPNLYGGTYNLLKATFARLGIAVRLADDATPEAIARAIDDTTRAVYIETIGNPRLDVPDIQAIAGVAHQSGLPLIVDNTFATPFLCRPIEHGADIVIHSATKFIGGHGQVIAGVIVDGGRFDWTNGRFPEFTEPDPTYHGLRYSAAFGPAAYILKARVQLLRDMGMCLSPADAHLLLTGLETVALRMERLSSTALELAGWLSQQPQVAWVNYPGLASHPQHANAKRYLEHGFGGIITFGLRGGAAAGPRFIDALKLFTHVANVGDARSLVIHPATTTHAQLTPEARALAGVPDDLVRLSIGLEDPEDLQEDLLQALAAAR